MGPAVSPAEIDMMPALLIFSGWIIPLLMKIDGS